MLIEKRKKRFFWRGRKSIGGEGGSIYVYIGGGGLNCVEKKKRKHCSLKERRARCVQCRCFEAALNKYQTRSLIVLYDTIGTLADNVGQCLAQPGLLAILMPPLMQRWNQVCASTNREDSL